jgi:HD-GYP domain-containing protein (c-di-GMP phosphodiesterase class II)
MAAVLDRLAFHASTLLRAEEVSIFAAPGESGGLPVLAARRGPGVPGLAGERSRHAVLATQAMRAGRPLLVSELEVDSDRRFAATPVTYAGSNRGALAITTRARRPSAATTERRLMGTLASLVGRALEHAEGGPRVGSYADPDVVALISSLASADAQTEEHCHAVASLARKVGRTLGMPAADLSELELAARLHDVGKVRVPRPVLRKPTALESWEWERMKLHPVWGQEILAPVPGLQAVALIVRLHHERLDGTGYPDGLPGERIPLACRIVSVCDAFGALTTDRPYRPARPPSDALGELRAHVGTQFDARAVKALADLVEPTEAAPESYVGMRFRRGVYAQR